MGAGVLFWFLLLVIALRGGAWRVLLWVDDLLVGVCCGIGVVGFGVVLCCLNCEFWGLILGFSCFPGCLILLWGWYNTDL